MGRMSKSNEIQFRLIEELFNEKIKGVNEKIGSVNEKIDALTLAINGSNGKKGILDRVIALENIRVYFLGFIGAIVLFFGGVSIYLRGFVEDVYKHIYSR